MRVVIVGAGTVGAVTAYFAAKRGHDVTLLERHPQAASETSFANAGQLSYSYTDPLAGPGLIRRLPAMLLGYDTGMHIHMDAALLAWGLRFLWYCNRRRAESTMVQLLQLAARSRAALDCLLSDISVDFRYRPAAGKLIVTSSAKALATLERRASLKRSHDVRVDVVGPLECRKLEPALESWRSPIAGGAYAAQDATGDARMFTRGLCEQLAAQRLVTVATNVEVSGLRCHRGTIIGVQTTRGSLDADAVVLCTGVATGRLLRAVGLDVPIYPLKGYSVTLPSGPHPPCVSITDLDRRIVFANLGGVVRLAGFADCVAEDASVEPRRIQDLVRVGRSVFPDAAEFEGPLNEWAGMRPATPSGLPIVGATRVRGLYLNVGHGPLGWTLACATGQQLAECLSEPSGSKTRFFG
jgi:D-amino-acid dehydrogenase